MHVPGVSSLLWRHTLLPVRGHDEFHRHHDMDLHIPFRNQRSLTCCTD
nr:unnamed protein product [Callosobruchus analis]